MVNVMQFLKQQHEKKKQSEDLAAAQKPPTPTKAQRKPSNSWSVSSDLSSEGDKKEFFDNKKSSTPVQADYQQSNVQSGANVPSEQGAKSNEKLENVVLENKSLNWDTSEDDSSSADDLDPSAYVSSIQQKGLYEYF